MRDAIDFLAQQYEMAARYERDADPKPTVKYKHGYEAGQCLCNRNAECAAMGLSPGLFLLTIVHHFFGAASPQGIQGGCKSIRSSPTTG